MVPIAEQQSPAIEITPKQHPPKQPLPFNSITLNLNAIKYSLSPFNSMTGDITEDNLRAIATPAFLTTSDRSGDFILILVTILGRWAIGGAILGKIWDVWKALYRPPPCQDFGIRTTKSKANQIKQMRPLIT